VSPCECAHNAVDISDAVIRLRRVRLRKLEAGAEQLPKVTLLELHHRQPGRCVAQGADGDRVDAGDVLHKVRACDIAAAVAAAAAAAAAAAVTASRHTAHSIRPWRSIAQPVSIGVDDATGHTVGAPAIIAVHDGGMTTRNSGALAHVHT
jgi:hypothetical protein